MSRGHELDSAVIQRGLMELQPDLNFDVGVRKESEWFPAVTPGSMDALRASQRSRIPVFYLDRYICAMDRGPVPEFKQWSVVNRLVPVGWDEADAEDVSLQHRTIRPSDPAYLDSALAVMRQDLGYQYRADGAIIQYTPMAYRKVKGKVVQVGWRHTFERIIHADIPRLTRSAIAAKFEVDMLKFPVGAPHEIIAELVEE